MAAFAKLWQRPLVVMIAGFAKRLAKSLAVTITPALASANKREKQAAGFWRACLFFYFKEKTSWHTISIYVSIKLCKTKETTFLNLLNGTWIKVLCCFVWFWPWPQRPPPKRGDISVIYWIFISIQANFLNLKTIFNKGQIKWTKNKFFQKTTTVVTYRLCFKSRACFFILCENWFLWAFCPVHCSAFKRTFISLKLLKKRSK